MATSSWCAAVNAATGRAKPSPVVSHKPRKSIYGFDLGACPRKTILHDQRSNQEKSQNRNISPIWGEAPVERIEMKICTDLH